MPVNLGKWSWLAETAIDLGLPVLATAIGVPSAAPFAINMIKKVLGLKPSATEEDVRNTLNGMPEDTARAMLEGAQSEVTAKYAYLTKLAQAQGEVNKTTIEEVNKTIRMESAKVSWWHWRHLIGYLVLLYGLVLLSLMIKVGFFNPTGNQIKDVIELFNATTPFTLGLFALLGAVAFDTTKRSVAANEGEMPESIITSTAKVFGKKK